MNTQNKLFFTAEPMLIRGHGASSTLMAALQYFVEDLQDWSVASPRGFEVRERINVSYHVEDVEECVAWLSKRKLNYSFMAAEFLWIWLGRDDVASISKYCREISKFSDDGEIFFGAYGPKIFAARGYLERALRRDPSTRQAVFTIWRPEPPLTKDVPCTVAAQFLHRDGCLHGVFTMRSSDVWLGLPYDLFNFCRTISALAERMNMHPGTLTINVGSAHLYTRNLDAACEVVAADMYSDLRGHPLITDVSEERLHRELDQTSHEWIEKGSRISGWTEIVSALRYRRVGDPDAVFGGLGTAVRLDLDE